MLKSVMEHIRFPALKRLQLYGIYEAKDRALVLKPEDRQSAPVTSLKLIDYEESPEATAQLLSWPKALTCFYFESFYNNHFTMDLPMFHSWLLPHKDTLKYIYIGYLSRLGSKGLFDAVDFPALEVLRLSRRQMVEDLGSPIADADALLAPNLKTFGWSFSIYDQHSESWTDFGSREEHWLREFARAALARKAKLQRIEITFNPYSSGLEEQDGYPWDRMDKIRDEVQPHGLTLVYDAPLLTKEEWLKAKKTRTSDEEGQMDDESTSSETTSSESSEAELVWPKLDDLNPGRDIQEFFPPLQAS